MKLWNFVIKANGEGVLESAKDINIGGLAVALAKSSAVSGLGVNVDVKFQDYRWIFDETPSRAIVEVQPKNLDKVLDLAKEFNLDVEVIGEIGGDEVKINDILLSLDKVKNLYFETFVKKVIQ